MTNVTVDLDLVIANLIEEHKVLTAELDDLKLKRSVALELLTERVDKWIGSDIATLESRVEKISKSLTELRKWPGGQLDDAVTNAPESKSEAVTVMRFNCNSVESLQKAFDDITKVIASGNKQNVAANITGAIIP